ncbi:MAG TPA: hypothetical protein PLQ97_08160 [Myxococcota bacterium]|nr:hypothetical protein [Myxococcota bacterium]HQK50862.1 hypothetical protein [Myxococcota bacterium]
MVRDAVARVPRESPGAGSSHPQRPSIRKVLFLLALAPCGCFADLTVPSCATLADCPAEYTACTHAHCFFRNTGCEEAAPVSGDGCCTGWETDRSRDPDCRTFDRTLEVSEFSLPAVRSSDGMLFFHARSSRDGLVHLLQVSAQGDLAWDLPLGSPEVLLPPLLWDDATLLSPIATGIQVVDVARRQAVDLVPSPAAPATPLGASDDGVAWVDQEGTLHLHRLASGLRLRIPGMGDRLPPAWSRQAETFLVVRSDGLLQGISPRATTAADAVTGSLDLGTPIATSPVILGDRGLVATTSGLLVAVSLGDRPWQQAWQANLGGPIGSPPLVDSRGHILVVRQDGTLFVVQEHEGQGMVTASTPLPGGAGTSFLAVTDGGRLVYFQQGRLRSLLVQQQGGGITFSEGFSDAFEASRGIPTLVERRIVLALDTGHLLGIVSPEGPDSGPWPRPLGDEANRMGSP